MALWFEILRSRQHGLFYIVQYILCLHGCISFHLFDVLTLIQVCICIFCIIFGCRNFCFVSGALVGELAESARGIVSMFFLFFCTRQCNCLFSFSFCAAHCWSTFCQKYLRTFHGVCKQVRDLDPTKRQKDKKNKKTQVFEDIPLLTSRCETLIRQKRQKGKKD